MNEAFILAIDQGTTGSTCMVFDADGRTRAKANHEFKQYFPEPGLVEHDPDEIWSVTLRAVVDAMQQAELGPRDITAVGITNQRETAVLWDAESGRAIGRAIVWQDRRSADICTELREAGHEPLFRERTGLLLDPYFSGTKLSWIKRHDAERARLTEAGQLAFGTIDSWLLHRLTGGKVHATDVSNASRTLLFNINTRAWDDELIRLLGAGGFILPEVCESSHLFGHTDPESFLGIEAPISGIAGDQQAALFGQCCFDPGMTKNTYGTGSFVLMNIGETPKLSQRGLLTTIAWGIRGKTYYALEGSIFITGAAINWLRDGLRLIKDAKEIEPLARKVADTEGVYFVPALVGMGAPYWDPQARAVLIGMTRGTNRSHVARAVIESMAFQTADVVELMQRESGVTLSELRVDGGASVMDLLLQTQADLLRVPVRRPAVTETTALGAALLAGLGVGLWNGVDELKTRWKMEREALPLADEAQVAHRYAIWRRAVEKSLGWAEVLERPEDN
ncbi:MAG: glycerol kinase GlpK [Candidatus Geothermincolia bacterium]